MSAKTDISQFIRSLKKEVRPRAIRGAVRGTDRFAHKVLRDAQTLAPVGGGIYSPNDPQPGRLKDSAIALEPQVNDTEITQVVGFNTEYAAVQHENLDFRHDQGQAKYLETSLRANAPQYPNYVRREIDAELEKQ